MTIVASIQARMGSERFPKGLQISVASLCYYGKLKDLKEAASLPSNSSHYYRH